MDREYNDGVNLKYIFETGQSSSPNEDGSHRFSIAMWVANYHGRASFTSAGDDIFGQFRLSIYSKTKKTIGLPQYSFYSRDLWVHLLIVGKISPMVGRTTTYHGCFAIYTHI